MTPKIWRWLLTDIRSIVRSIQTVSEGNEQRWIATIQQMSETLRMFSETHVHLETSNKAIRVQLFRILRNPKRTVSVPKLSRLKYLFPEEYVAELGALHSRLAAAQAPRWLIQLVTLRSIVEFFWAFYIQNKVENLFLPKKGNVTKIKK